MSSSTVLFYLAVGRLVKENGQYTEGKHQIIASATHPAVGESDKDADKTYKTHVKQIMDKGATKLTPGKRIRLTADDNNYDLHVMADTCGESLIIYFAVTDNGFSKSQNVAQLLDDLKAGFLRANSEGDIEKAKENGSVKKASAQLLNQLFTKYGTDKLKNVQAKVDQVKVQMQDGVKKALQNVDDLNELENKSEKFEDQAKNFEKGATKTRRMMRCREYKMYAIIAVVALIVIGIIIGVVEGGKSNTSAPTPG